MNKIVKSVIITTLFYGGMDFAYQLGKGSMLGYLKNMMCQQMMSLKYYLVEKKHPIYDLLVVLQNL